VGGDEHLTRDHRTNGSHCNDAAYHTEEHKGEPVNAGEVGHLPRHACRNRERSGSQNTPRVSARGPTQEALKNASHLQGGQQPSVSSGAGGTVEPASVAKKHLKMDVQETTLSACGAETLAGSHYPLAHQGTGNALGVPRSRRALRNEDSGGSQRIHWRPAAQERSRASGPP
jgi:hypothetical protein